MKATIKHSAMIPFLLFLLSTMFADTAYSATLGEPIQVPIKGGYAAPVWAPDGSGIAVSGEGYKGLYLVDPSGNVKTVSEAPLSGWRFQWSPDGRNLAYRAKNGSGTSLMIVGPDSQEKMVSPQIDTKSALKWDKNGLTYTSGDEMVTVDSDGRIKRVKSLSQGQGLLSKLMNLSALLVTGQMTGASLTALPTAASIQVDKDKVKDGPTVDSDSQIWITDEKGNKKKLLDIEGVPGYAPPVESPSGDNYAVAGFDGNLYIVNPDGGSPVNIGKGNNVMWSPDGKYVIYERNEDDGYRITSSDIWMSSIDGKYQFQLTSGAQIERSPSWSPDGKYIAYTVDGAVYTAPIEMR